MVLFHGLKTVNVYNVCDIRSIALKKIRICLITSPISTFAHSSVFTLDVICESFVQNSISLQQQRREYFRRKTSYCVGKLIKQKVIKTNPRNTTRSGNYLITKCYKHLAHENGVPSIGADTTSRTRYAGVTE